MKRLTKWIRAQVGFTLIELLIVVGIIAILVAVAIPSINRFMTAGSVGAANAELQMVYTAVDSCMAEAGVMELDDDADAWNGEDGAVTALDGEYDATEYLVMRDREGLLRGTYNIEIDGSVEGDEYLGLEWDEENHKWKRPSS